MEINELRLENNIIIRQYGEYIYLFNQEGLYYEMYMAQERMYTA